MKFVFTLQGVLNHRRQIEREKQRALADRVAAVSRLVQELREMDEQVQRSIAELRAHRLTGRLDLAYLAAHRRYTLAMQRRAMEQARRIAAAQQAVDAARVELVAAAKDRKVIEKLRERRYEQWRAEQARKEMAQLDEIAVQLARPAQITTSSPAGFQM